MAKKKIEEENPQIRVSLATKKTLEILKKKQSFDSYISKMLNYFLVTNIAPESCQVTPFASVAKDFEKVLERVNSVIEVVRGIEKSKLNPMFELMKLHFPAAASGETKASGDNETSDQINVEQVQAILQINEDLDNKLKLKNAEVIKLTEQLDKQQPAKDFNRTAIRQAVEKIKASAQTSTFREGQVTLNKTVLFADLDRILNEISE